MLQCLSTSAGFTELKIFLLSAHFLTIVSIWYRRAVGSSPEKGMGFGQPPLPPAASRSGFGPAPGIGSPAMIGMHPAGSAMSTGNSTLNLVDLKRGLKFINQSLLRVHTWLGYGSQLALLIFFRLNYAHSLYLLCRHHIGKPWNSPCLHEESEEAAFKGGRSSCEGSNWCRTRPYSDQSSWAKEWRQTTVWGRLGSDQYCINGIHACCSGYGCRCPIGTLDEVSQPWRSRAILLVSRKCCGGWA